MKENYQTIKDCFTYLAGMSKKSCIDMSNFMSFLEKIKVVDENLTLKDIETLFEEVNAEPVADQTDHENPADELVRYEFVEMLVRMADLKYRKPGILQTYAEAFGELFSNVIEPWYKLEKNTQVNFRVKHLIVKEVDDLMKCNKINLEKLWKQYAEKPKHKQAEKKDLGYASLTIDDLNKIFADAQIEVDKAYMPLVFGMSKQTVV